jgi:hypothetical protein
VEDPIAEIPENFSIEEALCWIHSVDGELYRTPPARGGARAWIAAVRTPRCGAHRAQLILALGNTALEATTAAAIQWRRAWSRFPRAG